jgi:cytochrome c5
VALMWACRTRCMRHWAPSARQQVGDRVHGSRCAGCHAVHCTGAAGWR